MQSDVSVAVVDGLTLVTLQFDNAAPVDRRVRVENRLDGPVLPPRRRGTPEKGWTEEGFEGVVPAESTLALGYACPVAADETADPVAVESFGRDAADADAVADAPTAADAHRELGPSRPPADALPAGPVDEGPVELAAGPGEPVVAVPESPSESSESPVSPVSPSESPSESSESLTESTDETVAAAVGDRSGGTDAATANETAVDASPLDAAARRVELAERLEGASVAEAAAILSASPVDPSSLSRLDADRTALRRLAARATALADRVADADPAVDALRRVT